MLPAATRQQIIQKDKKQKSKKEKKKKEKQV